MYSNILNPDHLPSNKVKSSETTIIARELFIIRSWNGGQKIKKNPTNETNKVSAVKIIEVFKSCSICTAVSRSAKTTIASIPKIDDLKLNGKLNKGALKKTKNNDEIVIDKINAIRGK